MFSPKWVDEAKHLHQGAKKFLNYKRDLLKPDRIAEIESRRADLLAAIKDKDEARAAEAGKQLRYVCEKALPGFPQQSAWEEQVEAIWVVLVIILGIRAYFMQPFRIPTGSMQPTLNGITVNSFPNLTDEPPNLLTRGLQMVTHGRYYLKIVAPADGQLDHIEDHSWLFFTRCTAVLTDGSKISIWAAKNEAAVPFLNGDARKVFKKGEVIFNGWVDSGDLVLVDKVSYHFRAPKRGEVFVFDTRDLKTSGLSSGSLSAQEDGTHFIKRLVGVPGDRLQISPPNLLVNGQVASEPGIRRVIDGQGAYGLTGRNHPAAGYQFGDPRYRPSYPGVMLSPSSALALADKGVPQGMREYAAMGDNTGNSLDSRYWGSVKEYNLVGTGFFSLWPFASGHWGFIK